MKRQEQRQKRGTHPLDPVEVWRGTKMHLAWPVEVLVVKELGNSWTETFEVHTRWDRPDKVLDLAVRHWLRKEGHKHDWGHDQAVVRVKGAAMGMWVESAWTKLVLNDNLEVKANTV